MQNLPEKKSEILQQFTGKKITILLSLCTASTLNTLALNTPSNPYYINEDVCLVFQRLFSCMNDPEGKQICTRANKLFRKYFLGLRTEHILKLINLNNLLPQNCKVYQKFCSVRSPTNTYRNNLVHVQICLLSGSFMHANGR